MARHGVVNAGTAQPKDLVYAAFFSTAWVRLFVPASGLVKLVSWLEPGAQVMRRWLNVEGRPIAAIGYVAMLLTTVVYWSLATVTSW